MRIPFLIASMISFGSPRQQAKCSSVFCPACGGGCGGCWLIGAAAEDRPRTVLRGRARRGARTARRAQRGEDGERPHRSGAAAAGRAQARRGVRRRDARKGTSRQLLAPARARVPAGQVSFVRQYGVQQTIV